MKSHLSFVKFRSYEVSSKKPIRKFQTIKRSFDQESNRTKFSSSLRARRIRGRPRNSGTGSGEGSGTDF